MKFGKGYCNTCLYVASKITIYPVSEAEEFRLHILCIFIIVLKSAGVEVYFHVSMSNKENFDDN